MESSKGSTKKWVREPSSDPLDPSYSLRIILLSLIGADEEHSTAAGLLNQIDERMICVECWLRVTRVFAIRRIHHSYCSCRSLNTGLAHLNGGILLDNTHKEVFCLWAHTCELVHRLEHRRSTHAGNHVIQQITALRFESWQQNINIAISI